MAQSDAVFFESRASLVEAAKLFGVEGRVFGEGHHGTLDADGLAGGEIANEGWGFAVRDADAADAGVNADVERNRLLRLRGDFV